jgi:hypothetical protein
MDENSENGLKSIRKLKMLLVCVGENLRVVNRFYHFKLIISAPDRQTVHQIKIRHY